MGQIQEERVSLPGVGVVTAQYELHRAWGGDIVAKALKEGWYEDGSPLSGEHMRALSAFLNPRK